MILASASPRRQELLRELVTEFEVVPADVDEEALTVSDPWETAESLARAKAKWVQERFPDALVIGGDTVVAIAEGAGYRQLAKPCSFDDAVEMLRTLSGRHHLVITGICVAKAGVIQSEAATTEVTFRELSDSEIHNYVATGEPMDKAGAYAIQGGAAGFVSEVKGSHSNVVGLPLEALRDILARV